MSHNGGEALARIATRLELSLVAGETVDLIRVLEGAPRVGLALVGGRHGRGLRERREKSVLRGGISHYVPHPSGGAVLSGFT